MISRLDILIKCIILLYREGELENEQVDSSKDLVKTILGTYSNSKTLSGGESSILDNLKDLLTDMLHNPDNYDKHNLLQSLELILRDHDNILRTIDKAVNTDMSQGGAKRSIVSIRNQLNNFYKEHEITKLVSAASYSLNTGKVDGGIQDFVSKLVTNLEALSTTTKTKDPGIIDEIDIDNDDDMDTLSNKVIEQSGTDGRYKTGWKELNDMTGGGMRAGEFVLTSALQHNYKSGFVQSLFAQLCMYNVPKLKDPNKKPLALFISFEDDAPIIANFLYRYLYFTENNKIPDLTLITGKEIGAYIKSRLTRTGFHIKILRVNPSEWTYKHMFNKTLEYEASGYELKFLINDYLSKMPTTGCVTSGPMGTDVRDLFNRVRNFYSSKEVLYITPHQLSSDAKQLLRNGIDSKELVKEIANKGFYEISRQLDQVVDMEIHQHIAYVNRKPFLTFQRGKRRFPEIIDEDKKYFTLPYPHKAPIPPNIDLDGNYIGFNYGNNITVKKERDDEFDF